MSNENNRENIDLFSPSTSDNLTKILERGTYKWTNRATYILLGLAVIAASISGGIWWGVKHPIPTVTQGGSLRSIFAGSGGFGGASGSGFGGGFGGGSRGSVIDVKGNTLTITLNQPNPSIKAGDRISITDRSSAGGNFGINPNQSSLNTINQQQNRNNSSRTSNSNSQSPTGAESSNAPQSSRTKQNSAGQSANNGQQNDSGSQSNSAPQNNSGRTGSDAPRVGGQGGGRGGFFSNPAFIKCLADNGVTITPGVRPDRNDPKVAAALQTCFQQLGASGGFGNGNSGASNSQSAAGNQG